MTYLVLILHTLTAIVSQQTIKAEDLVKFCNGFNDPWGAELYKSSVIGKVLKHRLSGCTHVVGHLSIAGVPPNCDLSFLESIREVYGSVFIAVNDISVIPLSNLRIIRGSSPYEWGNERYSLYIAGNRGNNKGKAYIDLRSLVSVMNYGIRTANNKNLCYLNTFNWNKLLEQPRSKVHQFNNTPNCNANRRCSSACPLSNGKRYCSGPEPSMCQSIVNCTRSSCKAAESRCLPGGGCCHKECAGGCTGPSRFECLACRHLKNDCECVQRCPSTGRNLTFGFMCVERCPLNYITEGSRCVKTCSANFYPQKDRCVRCTGNICDKVCRIADLIKKLIDEKPQLKNKIFVGGATPRSVMKKLWSCTIVDGSIKVTTHSHMQEWLIMEEHIRYEDFENLSNIEHINGRLHLYLLPYPIISVLKFLSNLESIQAPGSDKGLAIYFTHLEYLGLVKLRYLAVNHVAILDNRNLCYLERFKARFATSNITSNINKMWIAGNKNNCAKEGKVCHSECSKGCWGPGNTTCF